MSSESIAIVQGQELALAREPKLILDEARKAALALQDVIKNKLKPVVFNDEQYIEFEDWQMVGKFYNLAARVRDTRFVQFGDVMGWEATADIINILTGTIISSADSMCLNDEEKWSTKNKYEWQYALKNGGHSKEDPPAGEIVWEDNPNKPGKKRPKRERILIGSERVPQFQLRSMAQTRACSKAFGNVLRWVAVLAGYKPTPAEEHPSYSPESEAGDQDREPEGVPAPPLQTPQRKSETSPASNGEGPKISDGQLKRLWARGYAAVPNGRKSLEKNEIIAILKSFGYEHADDIPMAEYDAIIAAIDAGKPKE